MDSTSGQDSETDQDIPENSTSFFSLEDTPSAVENDRMISPDLAPNRWGDPQGQSTPFMVVTADRRSAGKDKTSPKRRKELNYDGADYGADKNSNMTQRCLVSPEQKRVCIIFIIVIIVAICASFLIGYFIGSAAAKTENSNNKPRVAAYHQSALKTISPESISEYSRMLDGYSCVSGMSCSKDISQVIADHFTKMRFSSVKIASYDVLMSTPNMTHPSTLKVLSATKDVVYSHIFNTSVTGRDSGRRRRQDVIYGEVGGASDVLTISGEYSPFSASGTVSGELVFVNHGRQEDYAQLTTMGISLHDKIAIMKHGMTNPMEQIHTAESMGIIGLIVYPDTADSGGVKTNSAAAMSAMFGDPLTPGCPSIDGIHRLSMVDAGLPSVPIQPVSMDTASVLLGSMNSTDVITKWIGNLDVEDMTDGLSPYTVELTVNNEQVQRPISNVIATIDGRDYPDEYVILGGHHTSMLSINMMMGMHGSSSMIMEAASALGGLINDGWQPKRTVVMGVWDGSDVNYAGSTEWVEDNKEALSERGVAYVNLDSMMSGGTTISSQTSPLLNGVVQNAADMLSLSHEVIMNDLSIIGDHASFSNMLGIPSASLGITGNYNTDMDSMSVVIATTQLATQVILSLADDDILGLDASSVVDTISSHVTELQDQFGNMMTTSFEYLQQSVTDFGNAVTSLNSMKDSEETANSPVTMTMINSRLMNIEKTFIDSCSGTMMRNSIYSMMDTDMFVTSMTNSSGSVSMDMLEHHMSQLQCSLNTATKSLSMNFS